MNNLIDVKICTACGSAPKIVKEVDGKYFVACYNPVCKERLATSNYGSKIEAVTNWNGGVVTSSFLEKPIYAKR
jgi:ssDNA-binding Zn-finger/Zn-ribbon topoisomerase 1